jgi:hypothetical protein
MTETIANGPATEAPVSPNRRTVRQTATTHKRLNRPPAGMKEGMEHFDESEQDHKSAEDGQ